MSVIMIAEDMVEAYFDGRFGALSNIDNMVDAIVDKLNEQELNPYQQFFKAKLEEFGVNSPSELDEEKKKEFFTIIKKEWKKEK